MKTFGSTYDGQRHAAANSRAIRSSLTENLDSSVTVARGRKVPCLHRSQGPVGGEDRVGVTGHLGANRTRTKGEDEVEVEDGIRTT